ncbi:MAG: Fic family protein, partial [Ruminococcus sp.]|nr:Fic family protein [Ruminococcus sp.]
NVSLTAKILIKAHEILMRGVTEEEFNNIRKNNNFFVGYSEDGKNVVQYFPISYDEIKQALILFLDYYNSQENSKDNLFIKPFTIHGLLAALQLFEDGNTRLARTMQHISLFQNTNQNLGEDFKLPILYFSNTYTPYRKEYRDLIMQIAINPSDESWNNWYLFNLRRAQDQIFANEEVLKRIRKN